MGFIHTGLYRRESVLGLKNRKSFFPNSPTLPVPFLPSWPALHLYKFRLWETGGKGQKTGLPATTPRPRSPFQRESLHVMFPHTLQRAEERKAQRRSRQSSHTGFHLGPPSPRVGSAIVMLSSSSTRPPRTTTTCSEISPASVAPLHSPALVWPPEHGVRLGRTQTLVAGGSHVPFPVHGVGTRLWTDIIPTVLTRVHRSKNKNRTAAKHTGENVMTAKSNPNTLGLVIL